MLFKTEAVVVLVLPLSLVLVLFLVPIQVLPLVLLSAFGSACDFYSGLASDSASASGS